MKKYILAVATLLLAAVAPIYAEGTETLAPKLQNVSVTVHAEGGQGSGTIITRSGINYVLTAGHVVNGNRKVTEVIIDGNKKTETSFDPVTIVKEIYVDGRSIGTTTIQGEVVAYSSPEYGDDVALLKLRSKITDDSIEFYLDNLVSPGTPLVHVGSLLGQDGSNSFTTGSMSQVGRVLYDKVFDQVSVIAFPGSSGGGVFLADGKYMGMLVRGAGPGFELVVPVRRIKTWAKDHNCSFLFDPKSTDVDRIKLETKEPVGDATVVRDSSDSFQQKFPYLLAK